jgi:hypothetical protein
LAAIAPAAGEPGVTNEDVAASQLASLGSSNAPENLANGAAISAPPVTTTLLRGAEINDDVAQDNQPTNNLPLCSEVGQSNCIPIE